MNPLALLSLLRNPWVLVIVVSVIGVGGTGWYRMRWLSEISGRQEAVIAAQKKADTLANELVIAQAQAMAVTEKTVTVYRDRIAHAAQTNTCGPVIRDALRGVRDTVGSQPDSLGGAPAAVRPAPAR